MKGALLDSALSTSHSQRKHSVSSCSIYCPPVGNTTVEEWRNTPELSSGCISQEKELVTRQITDAFPQTGIETNILPPNSAVSISDIDFLWEYRPTPLSEELVKRHISSAKSDSSLMSLTGVESIPSRASSCSSLSGSPRRPSRYFQDEDIEQIVAEMKRCIFSSQRSKILEERIQSSQLLLRANHATMLVAESGFISSLERKQVLLSICGKILERQWQERVIEACFEAKWDRQEMLSKCAGKCMLIEMGNDVIALRGDDEHE